MIRNAVIGHQVKLVKSSPPVAVYRWLAPASDIRESSDLSWLHEESSHSISIIAGPEGSFIACYPVRNNTITNFVAFHLDERDEGNVPGEPIEYH